MFYKCKSLVEFSNFEINKNEIKSKQKESGKYLDSENINKDHNFFF